MNNMINSDLIEQQTRSRLLTQLQAEKKNIIAAIEQFYAQDNRQPAEALQALEEMITAFDRVILAGDWDSSLFLRNTVKPLKNMREEAQHLRDQLLGNVKAAPVMALSLAPDMMKVYIAVFQHKAHYIKDWEPQLRSLPQYILGRPIYREEAAVRQLIRTKLIQTSDAYVCVGVPKTAVQTGEFHPSHIDKQGNELLQLIPGAVRSENILEFVYQDKRYYFVDGKLIET